MLQKPQTYWQILQSRCISCSKGNAACQHLALRDTLITFARSAARNDGGVSDTGATRNTKHCGPHGHVDSSAQTQHLTNNAPGKQRKVLVEVKIGEAKFPVIVTASSLALPNHCRALDHSSSLQHKAAQPWAAVLSWRHASYWNSRACRFQSCRGQLTRSCLSRLSL